MKKKNKKINKIFFYSIIIFSLFLLLNVISYFSIKVITKKNIYSKDYIEFKNFVELENIIFEIITN